jgi:hypothetical protein
VFERKLNKPLAVTDSELAVDMSTVCLHGANGDEEWNAPRLVDS